MTNSTNREFHSWKQVANILSICENTARALERHGKLKKVRLSAGRVAITDDSLRAYIKSIKGED